MKELSLFEAMSDRKQEVKNIYQFQNPGLNSHSKLLGSY